MTIKGQFKYQLKSLVAISTGLIAIENTSMSNKDCISDGALRYTNKRFFVRKWFVKN